MCGKWKQATEEYYNHSKERFDGLAVYCKPCSTERSVARKRTERGKALGKLSRLRNIEKIRAYQKKRQPIDNERRKARLKTDISFLLNNRMKCLMWRGLKKNKGGKSWKELAGYSIDDLRRHIEKQFKDGMSWEAFLHGRIHIDHKIPRAAFNFSHPDNIDFKRCWALKNLQPMWALENISKGARIDKPFQPALLLGA